jgi:hypothetical protein
VSDVPTGMYRTSHRRLLRRPRKPSDRQLDAIVMPAARPALDFLALTPVTVSPVALATG